MKQIDPFTRTPGVAGAAFIDTHYADEIIENLESGVSSKYVYKIVGLRGSGKSVEYRKIVNYLSGQDKWLVYTLSASGDPTSTLIAKLSKEDFINSNKQTTTISANGSAEVGIPIVKGKVAVTAAKTTEDNAFYYSPEATLSEMIQTANDFGYQILIGIDDIAKTPNMTAFLSILGALLLDDKKRIFFICTGLSNNIEDFSKEPNLTFFKRSDLIEIRGLNLYEIADMYQKLLGVNEAEAVRLSKFTCGYAYAYQVLGSLYFNKKPSEQLEDLIPEFDKILFRDSYDLIWKSLTVAERELVRLILRTEKGKTADIKSKMIKPQNYDSLRSRLMTKHLVDISERGSIKINLPRFKEYVMLWHEDD